MSKATAVSLAIRPRPVPLPRPDELPAAAPVARVDVLIDADAVSHGLAEGTDTDRASDDTVAACLEQVHQTAGALAGEQEHPAAPAYRVRCAASTETARHHIGLVLGASNNTWSFRRGIDGADHVLLEALESLATSLSRGCDHRSGRTMPAHLVVLVAQDYIYAPAVRQLRLLGAPTWVLQPGCYIATELYRAATAVTRLARPAA